MRFPGLQPALLCLALTLPPLSSASAGELDIADSPVFVPDAKPPVMVMLDNSGSMKSPLYEDEFDPQRQYYGLFEPDLNYVYDHDIPVKADAYQVAVNEARSGAFVASECTLSGAADVPCWSGNYLNWLSTRRIDAARKVLVGGKTENVDPWPGYGGGLAHKLVGNNEFRDEARIIEKSSPLSSLYSPVPDGFIARVYSPSDDDGAPQRAEYDPYAKLVHGAAGVLESRSGGIVGEYGDWTTDASVAVVGSGSLIEESWDRVTFAREYNDPIVVAKSISYNGGDPAIARIRNVGSRGFELSLQEWEYLDGNHTQEQVTWMVMERGTHTLRGGMSVVADRVGTRRDLRNNACSSRRERYVTPRFDSGTFSEPPTVITAVSSYNGNEAVVTRVDDVRANRFSVALQKEEANPGHPRENIDYIAFERGVVTNSRGQTLEAGVAPRINDDGGVIGFDTTFEVPPLLMTDMQTVRGLDTATLRQEWVERSEARVFVEEERSCDNEMSHVAEDIGYVALDREVGHNVAVAVPERPSGLLQDVANDVRLGISFYRYEPLSDAINRTTRVDGGTLQFQIPRNPFVAAPSEPAATGMSHVPGYDHIDGYAGAPIEDIVASIQNYPLVWGTTPLAENLWEVIQYFRQEPSYYDVADPVPGLRSNYEVATRTSPERDPFHDPATGDLLACANPSVILFTDGQPFRDANIPQFVVDYDEDGHPGDFASTDPDAQGRDNLDDVAYWARCDTSNGHCAPGDRGTRDLRPDIPGNQYLITHAVGFSEEASDDGGVPRILQDTADNGGGLAFYADDGFALEEALRAAFDTTRERASASVVAANSGVLQTGSLLYQATYNSDSWSGDLEAFAISPAGEIDESPTWSAAEQMPQFNLRRIYTLSDGEPTELRFNRLEDDEQAWFDNDPQQVRYLRGRSTLEQRNGGEFRNRDGAIGDIVHSSPTYVGAPARRIRPDDLEGESNRFSDFRQQQENRQPVVYVGANDGMLHAFNADTGEELFAYVPSMLLPGLSRLTEPNYTHRYFVDGTPTVTDAFYGGRWRTVLVGGLGAGGQGIYALDVTDPLSFDEDNVLWEFDDTDDADLGYTFSQPNVVRMANGEWAAVFGNGFNNTEFDGADTTSDSGEAVLYVVRVSDGELIERIGTGVGMADDPAGENRPNGLATVAPVDVNGDSVVDHVYAGDLFGNLWKFDLTRSNSNQWRLANGGNPLFSAACDDADCEGRQPITTRPQVGDHPTGRGVMVYFGTGKRFENSDRNPDGAATQSFYGIWDNPDASGRDTIERGELLQQEITREVVVPDGDGNRNEYREVTRRFPDWSEDRGWHLDLVNTGVTPLDNQGEHQAGNSILRNGAIVFVTQVPSQDPCALGGSSWIMELDAANGGRLDRTPFDIDGDGLYTIDDALSTDGGGDDGADPIFAGGTRRPSLGVILGVNILERLDNDDELKVTADSEGQLDGLSENPGPTATGRRSWQELR